MPTDNLTTVLGLIIPGLGHFARRRRVAAPLWFVGVTAAYYVPSKALEHNEFVLTQVNFLVALGLMLLPGLIAHALCLISAAWDREHPSTLLLISVAFLFPPAALALGWLSAPRRQRVVAIGAGVLMIAVDIAVWRAPLQSARELTVQIRDSIRSVNIR